MSFQRHPIRNLIFAIVLFAVSGSLLTASNAAPNGAIIEAAVRRHVRVGVTRNVDVIGAFGEPAIRHRARGPGEVEILGYNHEVVTRPGFALLPLLSFPRRAPADTFFEITDGLVTRYWVTAAH